MDAGLLMARRETQTETILIRDKNGTLVALEKCEYDQAKNILGVYIAPDDQGKGQTKALQIKAQTWAAYTTTRKINPSSVSHNWD